MSRFLTVGELQKWLSQFPVTYTVDTAATGGTPLFRVYKTDDNDEMTEAGAQLLLPVTDDPLPDPQMQFVEFLEAILKGSMKVEICVPAGTPTEVGVDYLVGAVTPVVGADDWVTLALGDFVADHA